MKEVKTPKKPLAYYYGIVLIVLIVFNLVVTPILMKGKGNGLWNFYEHDREEEYR